MKTIMKILWFIIKLPFRIFACSIAKLNSSTKDKKGRFCNFEEL